MHLCAGTSAAVGYRNLFAHVFDLRTARIDVSRPVDEHPMLVDRIGDAQLFSVSGTVCAEFDAVEQRAVGGHDRRVDDKLVTVRRAQLHFAGEVFDIQCVRIERQGFVAFYRARRRSKPCRCDQPQHARAQPTVPACVHRFFSSSCLRHAAVYGVLTSTDNRDTTVATPGVSAATFSA